MILPRFQPYCCRSNISTTKSGLHTLFLACKAYWAEQDGDSTCDVGIASQPEYRFAKSEGVEIRGTGTETTFPATARHQEGPPNTPLTPKGLFVKEPIR